jgi:uncharacterized protein (TIRG00374 family)
MKTRAVQTAVLRLLGLALLAILVVAAGPRQLLDTLRDARWEWLLFGFLLNLPQLGLKALRWKWLVHWQGYELPYSRAILAYFGALLVGFLTPGRLGEVVKAFTVRNEAGAPLARGVASVVADRLFDLYLLLVLGTLAFVRLALVGDVIPRGWFVFLLILLLLPLLALNRRSLQWGIARLRRLLGEGRWADRLADFADGLSALTPPRAAVAALLTVAAYSIFFLQCFCCAWALGFTLPVVDLVLLMAATNLIGLLPFAPPSNVGTREAMLIFLLEMVRPGSPAALAVSWGVTQFLVLFAGGGLIGLVCWQIAPLGLRRAVAEARHLRSGLPPA